MRYVVQFDGDDMVAEAVTDDAWTEIYRIPDCACGEDGSVERCTDQIDWIIMMVEMGLGERLDWTLHDDDTELVATADPPITSETC